MNSQGQFVAALLDSSSKALAARAVSRMRDACGEDRAPWAFQDLVNDIQARVQSLAEALSVGVPELLRLDLQWLAETYDSRGIPRSIFKQSLECLRSELRESLPEDAGKLAAEYVEVGLGALVDTAPVPRCEMAGDDPESLAAQQFLLAVLEGRRADAQRQILDAFDAGASIADLHRGVIGAVQVELGRLWQIGEADISEEHLGSRIVEDVLALLRMRAGTAEPNGRSVLVASVRGNLHDIGARMVSDQLEVAGWRTLFLGADSPAEDIVAAVGHFDVDLVAVSVGLGLHMRAAAELVDAVHQGCPGVPVLVGGRPFSILPDLWKVVGADGYAATAEGALRECERLFDTASPASS